MILQTYVANAEKRYLFRVKTTIPIDDLAMDRIEMAVAKYDPITITKPYKTILQRAPLDFPQLASGEIYILDITTGLPVAPHILRDDLRYVLRATDDNLVVRDSNEPGEIETGRLNALADIAAEAEKRGLKPAALLTDGAYDDADQTPIDLYGNQYNSAFLSHLAQVRSERDEMRYKVQNAPFAWLDMPKPEADDEFNIGIPGAPLVHPKKVERIAPVMSVLGSFSPTAAEVRKVYLDDKGERVVLTRKVADAN